MTSSSSSSAVESISGLIERVTFFNEENGFAVLRVQVRGRRDLATVIGVTPSANPGEWLSAEGRWIRDAQHGMQFKADWIRCAAPQTKEGIAKYLGGGFVKGVGPIYAQKLVDHFGENIFEIIDQFSARLEEVDGIGPARRRQIKQAWTESKTIREIMVFLHSQGVSSSRAVRIFKTYGEEAVEKVRADPYALARDIPGIGFKSADQIARRLGIPGDSFARVGAGVCHVLNEAADDGHCALPRPRVLSGAAALLEVPEARVAEAIEELLRRGELALEENEGEPWLFLPALRRFEMEIAARICALVNRPIPYPKIDCDQALEWFQKKSGLALGPTQADAVRMALAHSLLLLTGGPGVGKTTVLRAILAILRAKKIRFLLCAPTGRAARRLSEATGFEAQTAHRLLEYRAGAEGFARNQRHPLEADLIVLDESSMIDLRLMHALLRAHPPAAALILVGDADQLPPVGPGFPFQSFLESGRLPIARLTEIYRQAAHSRIIRAAHGLLAGRFPEFAGKDEPSDFYSIWRESAEAIAALTSDLARERLPAKWRLDPIADIQVLTPMNRGALGMREMNARLQAALNPPRPELASVEKFGWTFRPGDKVIQNQNNYDREVFNGDIGRVLRIDSEAAELIAEFNGRAVVYPFGQLDELDLAYAITIHKAQGSEFPAVILPLAMQHYLLLQRNLIYTAITRGKRLVVIVGQKKALECAIRNRSTQKRYTALCPRIKSQI